MRKQRINNLELVYLSIWLNLMNSGEEICTRWTNSSSGFLNFKKDGFKEFLVHVETYGTKRTFLSRFDNKKSYNPDNCYWTSQKELVLFKKIDCADDFLKSPYKTQFFNFLNFKNIKDENKE